MNLNILKNKFRFFSLTSKFNQMKNDTKNFAADKIKST